MKKENRILLTIICGAALVSTLGSSTSWAKSTEQNKTTKTKKEKVDVSTRSGIRLGYGYQAGKLEDTNVPHFFTMGYELQQTVHGGAWLDILFVQNLMIGGLAQSEFIPSVNMLIGFEIDKQIQFGVGPNFSLWDPSNDDKFVHMVAAVGWQRKVGKLTVPIHLNFVPDKDGYWRSGVTTGVNW
jgi:hypothetical protein